MQLNFIEKERVVCIIYAKWAWKYENSEKHAERKPGRWIFSV